MDLYESIKHDLLTTDSKSFYLKHIVKSHNWYFSEYLKTPQSELIDKMDFFKEIVSSNLGINFHNSQIVGSAKTGYSLSPSKMFKPFHDQTPTDKSSDIDIALISEKLFLHFWDELRRAKRIQYSYHYKTITASIFRGYLNDSSIKAIDGIREEWDELVSPVNVSLQDKLRFEHPITYRIYRSWEDLEDYQLIGISKARKTLEDGNSV